MTIRGGTDADHTTTYENVSDIPADVKYLEITAPAAPAEPTFTDGFGKTDCTFDSYTEGDTNAKGYIFAGWFDGDTKLASAADAEGGKTYTAKWTNNGKTVRTTALDLGDQTTDLSNTDEGWNWDAASKTLTLDGATFDVHEDGANAVIYLPDGAIITTVKGTKNVLSNSSKLISTPAEGDPFTGGGIMSDDKLTITGEGELSVTGGYFGVFTMGDLTIDAPISVTCTENDRYGYAISAGGESTISIDPSLSIKTPAGGKVGSNEELGSIEFVAESDGTTPAKKVVIDLADPAFTDGLGNTIDNADAYVKGKTTNAKGYTFAGWVGSDGNVVFSAADATPGVTYTARWSNNGKLVRTEVLDLTQTNVDQKDIAEGWSWDAKTKTLTLNGATFDVHQDGDTITAIALPDGATITTKKGTKNVVINESKFTGVPAEWKPFVGGGIMSEGKLTINGEGDLAITGGSCGVLTMDKLTINAPISVNCTESTEGGYIYALMVHGEGNEQVTKDMISINSSLRIKTPANGKINAELLSREFEGSGIKEKSVAFVADSNGNAATSVEIVKVSNSYYDYGGSTTSNTPGKSPKTADAGIALYAGMAAASLLGSGVVFSRKRKIF